MKKFLISREEFVKGIDRLREATDLVDKINNIMRESRDNIENDFMNASALQITHEQTVVNLLEKLTHDDEIYSDISYFIYELDYGRKYEPGMIKDKDGNELDFSNAGNLYDYLFKNYVELSTDDCKIVEKKILQEYYEAACDDKKLFEIRKDEDNVQVGDILTLKEWGSDRYTGRQISKKVTYVLRNVPNYGLKDGYCLIGWAE